MGTERTKLFLDTLAISMTNPKYTATVQRVIDDLADVRLLNLTAKDLYAESDLSAVAEETAYSCRCRLWAELLKDLAESDERDLALDAIGLYDD